MLGPVIRDTLHLLKDEDRLDDTDEAMQKCLGAAESDMWPYAYQSLDDADIILQGLSADGVKMARSQSVRPMTEYAPCSWNAADLPRIMALLVEAGWEVRSTTFHPA